MKVAVIISGHMRSFEECLPNLEWMVFRHFPDAKFYVATHNDEDAHKATLLTKKHKHVCIDSTLEQPEMVMPAGCPSVWKPGENYMHEPYAISVTPAAVLGQLWALQQGYEFYLKSGGDADIVIRCRPDLWFHSFRNCYWPDEKVAFTPWWGRFGGINDRFAILGFGAAKEYFTTYSKVERLIEIGSPLHPETLVAESMRDAGCIIRDDLKAEFSTVRKGGQMRPPEITSIDIAHSSL